MSVFTATLPWDLGLTYHHGKPAAEISVLGGANFEGMEYVVRDDDPLPRNNRTGRLKRVRLVRNLSGFTLLPKRQVVLDVTGRKAIGYPDAAGQKSYPVDEFLPAAGVLANDLFYIVTAGPAMCFTSSVGDAQNVFTAGMDVIGLSAATSGVTTGGRLRPADYTGATSVLAAQIHNSLGTALTAKTTSNTGADILVMIRWD